MSNPVKNKKTGRSASTMWRVRLLLVWFCGLTSSAYAWDFAEHRKIGDRAMILMPERLVAAGIFPDETTFYALLDSVLDVQLSEDSLSFVLNELSQAPNRVTYDTLCGLAGDLCLIPCCWRPVCRRIIPRPTAPCCWRWIPCSIS